MNDGIYMNPKNADVLRCVVADRKPSDPPPSGFLDLCSMPVYFSEFIPERNLIEQWCPPEGDRFCDYGPEDEMWMRHLGLGTIKTIDMGPLILKMQDRINKRIEDMLFDASPTFLTTDRYSRFAWGLFT